MKALRYISVTVALIFALLVFGAMAFEMTEQGHDCCGEGCAVCAVIDICENMLSGGGAAFKAAALLAAVYVMISAAVSKPLCRTEGYTLISLKVRLDD